MKLDRCLAQICLKFQVLTPWCWRIDIKIMEIAYIMGSVMLGIGESMLLIASLTIFSSLLAIIGIILGLNKLLRKLTESARSGFSSPKSKPCPKCLSIIPISASNCPWCKSRVE